MHAQVISNGNSTSFLSRASTVTKLGKTMRGSGQVMFLLGHRFLPTQLTIWFTSQLTARLLITTAVSVRVTIFMALL